MSQPNPSDSPSLPPSQETTFLGALPQGTSWGDFQWEEDLRTLRRALRDASNPTKPLPTKTRRQARKRRTQTSYDLIFDE